MTTFTVFATGNTNRPLADVEAAVRAALQGIDVDLIPCNWAPDADTIADNCAVEGERVELVDLN